jgi:LysR family transcriptional regulator, glycine cleavage system transcriptional activator
MAQRPPPFSALRTLEAAARLRSYTAAAAELMVTHSAVSQAIRRLEEELGAKLFYRRGSFMEPAPSTLVLARAYHEAAAQLSRSLIDIAGRNTPDKLVVSVPPGLARLWLSPRLPRLAAAFPGVSCDLRTSRELASLDGDGVDLAIRFGMGPWPPCRAEPLFDINLFPVASLDLARRHPSVTPALISTLPLIEQPDHAWDTWFAPSGVNAPGPGGRDTFDDEQLALDSAAAGMGVALTYAQAAEPYLADGRLVRFGDLSVPTGRRAWLVWREDNPKLRLIRNFSWWLRGELGQSEAQRAGTAA